MIIRSPFDDVQFFRAARTFAGRAVYWSGFYFVDGLLVDSGPPNVSREVAALFAELGVRACVTTHHHEDHSGNHALLQERFGIVPAIHPLGIERVARRERLQLYRRVAWGTPRGARCAALGQRVETPRFCFDVIHTPGHAEDHVVLHERNRGWLFTGDLYLGPRLKYVRADEDVHALMASLERAIALHPRVLFCNHRGPVEDATVALRRKLEGMRELAGIVGHLHSQGQRPDEIARALPGGDLFWRVWTGGHFSKLNFVRAVLRGS
jgi:glyoxylase-like metal-dependent hydrolase (beta-lactamase superfamily II)